MVKKSSKSDKYWSFYALCHFMPLRAPEESFQIFHRYDKMNIKCEHPLCITDLNNTSIKEVNSIEVIKDKGIVDDRYLLDYNNLYNQITLIES